MVTVHTGGRASATRRRMFHVKQAKPHAPSYASERPTDVDPSPERPEFGGRLTSSVVPQSELDDGMPLRNGSQVRGANVRIVWTRYQRPRGDPQGALVP